MPNLPQEDYLVGRYVVQRRRQVPLSAISFTRPQKDPPDFWVLNDELLLAVEITTIRDDDETTWRSLCGRIERVGREALAAGELQGSYCVSLSGKAGNGRELNELCQIIREYVRETAGIESPAPTQLLLSGKCVGQVHKYSSSGQKILPLGSTTDAGMVDNDAEESLRRILTRGIDEKARLCGNLPRPRVLILYDLFGWDSRKLFRDIVRSIRASLEFDEIFVVDGFGREYFVTRRVSS